VITENPLTTCGSRKFQLDPRGDHLNTCTVHSGTHTGWLINQCCGDIDLAGYLVNETVPVPLVLDLHIAHDRVGSSTDPTLNGHLRCPNNLDCLLLLVRLGGCTVNLSDFYSYRFIGKLTAFLQLGLRSMLFLEKIFFCF